MDSLCLGAPCQSHSPMGSRFQVPYGGTEPSRLLDGYKASDPRKPSDVPLALFPEHTQEKAALPASSTQRSNPEPLLVATGEGIGILRKPECW